jgi:hypothetical protein
LYAPRIAAAFVALQCATAIGCASPPAQRLQEIDGEPAKVGPELVKLYSEYSAHLASPKRGRFQPANPLVRVIDDRVLIDAVASGDAEILKADLIAIGMRQAVAFGRMVSGELPIETIPAIENLQSLNYARAASTGLHKPGNKGVPDCRDRAPGGRT